MNVLTDGFLLGGKVRYRQPASGFRSGIEPVLLAASIPARAGDCVLEAGTGAGAGLLCLAARVALGPSIGVEIDPALACLAEANAAANGFNSLRFLAADIAAFTAGTKFGHAFANPPYHGPGTPSPMLARESAKRADASLAAIWARALAGAVKPGGTVSFIIAAASVSATIAALQTAGCGQTVVFPFWPRQGSAAKLVLVQAKRGKAGPDRILPGLVLHEGAGFSEAGNAVLRGGAALDLR
jgi:tRNA1(Val) A37 N6-methylase TrmN6